MFTLIIIIAVIIFLVGVLKELSPEERSIVTKWGKNYIVLALVYLWYGIKSIAQIAWYGGRITGGTLTLEGQEQIEAMAKKNQEFADEGGATKIAIRNAKSHAEAMQVSGIVNSLKAKADTVSAEVEAKRQELKAKYNLAV